nr:hypothetical protein 1634Bnrm2_p163 [Cryptomonas sp.]
MLITKIGFDFIHKKGKCDSEDLRYECGFETEISEKIKKKFISLKKIKLNRFYKNYKVEYLDYLKNKSDIITLIKSTPDGFFVDNLLKSYPNIKTDLLDLVSHKEKDRKVIIIKGRYITDLLMFPYDSINYISTSEENVISWHKYYSSNQKKINFLV